MSMALKIATLALMTISMACDGTGVQQRAELYKMVDELCERCTTGIGGRCEFDAALCANVS